MISLRRSLSVCAPRVRAFREAFLGEGFLVSAVKLCALPRQARALRPAQLLGECGSNRLAPIPEFSPGDQLIDSAKQIGVEGDPDLRLRQGLPPWYDEIRYHEPKRTMGRVGPRTASASCRVGAMPEGSDYERLRAVNPRIIMAPIIWISALCSPSEQRRIVTPKCSQGAARGSDDARGIGNHRWSRRAITGAEADTVARAESSRGPR